MPAFLAALIGFFKFFDQVSSFIKLLEGTSEEDRQKISADISLQLAAVQSGGRPKWGD